MERERLAVIRLRIEEAMRRASGEVSGHAGRHGGKGINYAGGLASEGWSGGYWQALADVDLLMRGVKPHTRDYWPEAVMPLRRLPNGSKEKR